MLKKICNFLKDCLLAYLLQASLTTFSFMLFKILQISKLCYIAFQHWLPSKKLIHSVYIPRCHQPPPLSTHTVHIRITAAAAAAAKSLQSCLTLCDPIDGSPPDSLVPGILQARTLKWVAISFSNAWNWKVKVKSLSRVRLFRPHGLQPIRLLRPWDFPGKSTGVECHRSAYTRKIKITGTVHNNRKSLTCLDPLRIFALDQSSVPPMPWSGP